MPIITTDDAWPSLWPTTWPGAQEVVPGPRPPFRAKIPELTLCVGGVPFEVSDSLAAVSNIGGYATLSERLPARKLRKAGIDQEAPVQLFTSTGVKWEGTITQPPTFNDDGTANIDAEGPQRALEDKDERLFFQSRDPGLFQLGTTPPHGYAVNKDFEVDPRESALFYEVKKETYAFGDTAWLAAWVEGTELTRFQATIDKQRDTSPFSIRVTQATGPTGVGASPTDYNLGAAGPGSIDKDLNLLPDLVLVGIRCDSAGTSAVRNTILLINLLLHGIADTDTYGADEVLTHLCTLGGFDPQGINTTALGLDVMPLDWTDSWAALADYALLLTDGWWRLVDDRGNGSVMEADTWANARTWRTTRAQGCRDELRHDRLYNQATTHYTDPAGNRQSVTQVADPNPLDDVVDFPFELDDPQANDTLATAVTAANLAWASSKRHFGQLVITKATSEDGNRDFFDGKAGDKYEIGDWDLGEAFAHRCTETTIHKYDLTAGIEFFPSSAERIIASKEQEDARRRRKRRPETSKGRAGGVRGVKKKGRRRKARR